MTKRRSHSRRRRGVALVLVLVFIVLATITVMAFFSRALLSRQIALTSAGQVRADQLANATLAVIVGDLREEIAAGSEVFGPADNPVFLPRPDPGGTGVPRYSSMQPLRVGVPSIPSPLPADFPLNYIRRSTRPADLPSVPAVYGTLGLRAASAVDSSTSQAPGTGPVQRARWNRHFLLPQADPAGDSPEPVASFVPPDWMYVTRSGFGVTANGGPISAAQINSLRDNAANNPDFVIGRVAYAIYDIGGLLDINVAGHMPTTQGDFPAIPGEEIVRKGSLGLADLRVVPGLLDPGALVQRRNAFTARKGSFAGEKIPSEDAPDYIKYLFDSSLHRGHTRVHPGDQTFVNRQDLLRFTQSNPTILRPSALRYFTSFQRSLHAPSFSPSNPRNLGGAALPRQNSVDYEVEAAASRETALAGLSALHSYGWAANRVMPLPNRNPLRVTVPENVTTLKDYDGKNIVVQPGQPVPFRRFPLERIDLFRQYEEARRAGQSTADIERSIRYSFGLIPDPAAPGEFGRWIYINRFYLPGGSGAPQMRLLTLDEVVSPTVRAGPSPTNLNTTNTTDPFNEPRLPNFFEILQNAMLHGDVGYGNSLLLCNETRIYEILQIGANIIDQYDEDQHPTFIRAYAFRSAFGEDRSQNRVLVGKENLPQLSEVMVTAYRPTTVEERKNIDTTLEFEIWNPHQNAGDWRGAPVPIRLTAQQGAAIVIVEAISHPSTADPDSLLQEVDFALSNKFRMEFEYPTAGSMADPTMLSSSIPGITNASRVAGVDYGPSGPFELYGLHVSSINAPDAILSPEDPRKNNYNSVAYRPITSDRNPLYELQYLDSRSTPPVWKTYNVFSHAPSPGTGWRSSFWANAQRRFWPGSGTPDASAMGERPFTQSGQRTSAWAIIDPRRSRFNLMGENETVPTPNASIRPGPNKNPFHSRQYFITNARDISVSGGPRIPSQDGNAHFPDDLVDNTGSTASPSWFMQGYDGVRRPTDADAARGILPATNIGMNWFLQNLAANSGQSGFTGTDVGSQRRRDRPVHLNRPFRSVAELGYVFAEQPWKTLDFRSHLSPHTGLLDWFSLTESEGDPPIVGGTFNLNSAHPVTLAAVLAGAGKNPLQPGERLTDGEASAIADTVREAIAASGPLRSRADLVAALDRATSGDVRTGFPARKTEREAAIRALASTAETRTWNLLIDVIAQSGRLSVGATNLDQFQVQGERRYWLSVAIDRLTGQVVAQNLELVYE